MPTAVSVVSAGAVAVVLVASAVVAVASVAVGALPPPSVVVVACSIVVVASVAVVPPVEAGVCAVATTGAVAATVVGEAMAACAMTPPPPELPPSVGAVGATACAGGVYAACIALKVVSSTTPLAVRPWLVWKSRIAAAVRAPSLPSAVTPSSFWTWVIVP